MRHSHHISIVVTLLACITLPVHSEVRDSIEQALDEVLVAASRIDRRTIPAQSLDRTELERMSVHSVAEALRYMSGVQIKDYGGIGGLKTVNVRSLGGAHTGIFYDGIQLDNAQNGTIDLGRYSLDNMESLTMFNGQKSSIFQPAKAYSNASTVYLQSRRPSLSKTDKLSVGLSSGSFDMWNPTLLWEHRLNGRISSAISAEYMNTSGQYDFTLSKSNRYDTTMVRTNGDVEYLRAEATLFGKSDRDDWTAKAYAYRSERGYPGAVVRDNPGHFQNQDRQWDTDIMIQASWQHDMSDRYSIKTHAKYAYDYLHYESDPTLNASTMYVNDEYRQQEAYASAVQLFGITPWWSASLSTDFQYNHLQSTKKYFSNPSRYTVLAAAATAIEWKGLKCQASALYTYVSDVTDRDFAHGTKTGLTPSAALSWQPIQGSGWNLRGFYKRVFRMPTLNDIYYTVIGSRPLDPEYATQYDLGTTFTREFNGPVHMIELQADIYYNKVDDKIVAMPSSNQFQWTMKNFGRVEIRGIDAMARMELRTGRVTHNLRMTYTHQEAQDMTDSHSMWYGGQIPYAPWHSGAVTYSAGWRDWYLNYDLIFTGLRYMSVANITENRLEPWHTHDLGLGKGISIDGHDLDIGIDINNILNKQYEVVHCYPMPGINWKLRIRLTL